MIIDKAGPHGGATYGRRSIASRSGSSLAVVLVVSAVGLLACDSSDPLEEVRRLQQAGNSQATIEPLRELMEERPDDPEVHYRYGVALVSMGRAGVAVWSLRKAMESAEWHDKASILLATTMLATTDWDGAVEICDELLEVDPDDHVALRLRAKARVGSRRDYEGALVDADHLLELDPDDVDGLVLRTIALLALARIEEAEASLETLHDHFRDDSLDLAGSPRLCAALATFAKEKGELELAGERFDQCLESFPSEAIVLNAAIGFYDEQGRPERSIAALEAALESAPTSQPLRTTLALRLRAAGREDEALELLRGAIELPPPADPADAWLNIASFHIGGGRFDEGVDAYEKALELIPEQEDPLKFTYADALVLAKRYDEALEVAGEMDSVAFREFVRGRVTLERHAPAAALEHFEEGLRLWPDNAVVRYYAALASEQIGDFERAVEHYRYSIRADATASDATLRLVRLHVAAERLDEALTALTTSPPDVDQRIEYGLLQLEIHARTGRKMAPKPLVEFFLQRGLLARGAVARARGIYELKGPEGAIAILKQVKPLELTEPQDVAALEAMTGWLVEIDSADEGRRLVDLAVEAHPEVAAFHALQGSLLTSTGGEPSMARAAYEQALAIDATQPIALRGLAALDAEQGRTEQAIALYERAIDAEPDDRRARLALAELLSALDQREAAERVLEELLRSQPYDAEAALTLAQLRLERGIDDARTRELARRAVRFRGGEEAEALVERLGAEDEAEVQGQGVGDATASPSPGS